VPATVWAQFDEAMEHWRIAYRNRELTIPKMESHDDDAESRDIDP
jgi:hypothetical protein